MHRGISRALTAILPGALLVTPLVAQEVRIPPDTVSTVFAESELLSCPNGVTFDDGGDLLPRGTPSAWASSGCRPVA